MADVGSDRQESPGTSSGASPSLSMGAAAAGVGGLLIIIGVLIAWWATSAGVNAKGTEDFSGWAALIFGLVGIVTAGASAVMSDTATRKPVAAITMVLGLLAILATIVGFFRADSVAGSGATLEPGLYVSFFGAIVMTVGGYLAGRTSA